MPNLSSTEPTATRPAHRWSSTLGAPPAEKDNLALDYLQPPVQPTTGRTTVVTVMVCFILIALDRTELVPAIHPLVVVLYRWFVILSAFGLLLGVGHLLQIHLRRVIHGEAEWGLSLLLVATALATLVAGLLQRGGVTGPLVEWIFDAFLAPGAATLYALIIFFLAAAAYRYLRVTTPGGGWILAGVLLMVLLQMPLSSTFLPSAFGEGMAWLLQAPVMATFRGALLGSALALILIGIRYLLGRAQP
jgi:hypothetical protein